jgi:hypothetical protein
VRGLVLESVIAHVVAKATPFTLGDARLLAELLREAGKALSEKGILCPYGADGLSRGKPVCIPGRWTARDLAAHEKTCRHCPVFQGKVPVRQD